LAFSSGRIDAHNTDVEGFLAALRERVPEAPAGMEANVLGAGGAARAVVYALLQSDAARIRVWNRHPERARRLVESFSDLAPKSRLEAVKSRFPPSAEILVNATSVGMPTGPGEAQPDLKEQGVKELPVLADEWSDRQIVVDLVYRQEGTPLVRLARARGVSCVDGFDVLVHQGAASFRLWTGRKPPLRAMRSGAKHGKTH
jgi:shikimate dehydrogenase